jgi:hypothetical protein
MYYIESLYNGVCESSRATMYYGLSCYRYVAGESLEGV